MKRPAPKGISSTNPYYWNRHYHSKHDWEWVGRTILVLLFFHFAYQWYSTQRKQKEYLAQEKERQRHSRLLLETTASGKTEKREAAATKRTLENESKMRTPSDEDTGVEQTESTTESCPVDAEKNVVDATKIKEENECAPKEDGVKALSNNNVKETNVNDDDEGGVNTTTTTIRTPNPSRLLLVADTKKKNNKNNNARKTPQKLPYKKVISNFEETVQKLGKEQEESTKSKHKLKHLPVASLKDDRMYDPMYSFWEWCTVQCSLFRTFTLERADGIPVTPPYLDANHFVNNIHKHSNVQGTIPMQFQVTNEYPKMTVAAYWYNVETAMAEYKGMIYPGETWCPNTYNDHPWIFAMVINPGKAVTDVSQQQVIFYYVAHRIIPDPQKHHQDDSDDNNNNTGLAHHFFIHPPTSSINNNSSNNKSKKKSSNQNYYCSINDPMFPFPPSDCLTTPRLAVQWTLDYCLYRVEYTHWNILLKYLRNIVQDPHNVQYRQLKLSPNTSTFAQKVWNTPARGLLLAVGFQEQHTTTTTTTTSSSSSSDCEKSKTKSKSQLLSLLSDYVELPWTTDMTDNINELIQAIEHYQQLQQERREQQMVKHSSYQQQQQQQSNQDVSAAYQQQPIIHYHH